MKKEISIPDEVQPIENIRNPKPVEWAPPEDPAYSFIDQQMFDMAKQLQVMAPVEFDKDGKEIIRTRMRKDEDGVERQTRYFPLMNNNAAFKSAAFWGRWDEKLKKHCAVLGLTTLSEIADFLHTIMKTCDELDKERGNASGA